MGDGSTNDITNVEPGLEAGWIDAAIDGNSDAFARLYDRHVERVYRHVLYRIGNSSDAEDVTQQVFIQAWRAINRYERRSVPFIAWLLTIAHNAVVSFFRRSKTTNPFDLDPVTTQRWANPEAEAIANYDQLVIRRAVLRLKPDQQQVIILRFIENIEFTDIARALGKNEGNVRVIQHRALLELRRLLAIEGRRS